MLNAESRRPAEATANHTSSTTNHEQRINPTTSRQVDWWSVHEWVAGFLDRAGSWPMLGTPEWNGLRDGDPRKLAAVLDAGRHWALRVDASQEARAEASRAVAAAEDWSATAGRSADRRQSAYVERRAS